MCILFQLIKLDAKPSLSQLIAHVHGKIDIKWFQIGALLGIDQNNLECIEENQ